MFAMFYDIPRTLFEKNFWRVCDGLKLMRQLHFFHVNILFAMYHRWHIGRFRKLASKLIKYACNAPITDFRIFNIPGAI